MREDILKKIVTQDRTLQFLKKKPKTNHKKKKARTRLAGADKEGKQD